MKTRSVGFELCHAHGRGGYNIANSGAQLHGFTFTPIAPATHS